MNEQWPNIFWGNMQGDSHCMRVPRGNSQQHPLHGNRRCGEVPLIYFRSSKRTLGAITSEEVALEGNGHEVFWSIVTASFVSMSRALLTTQLFHYLYWSRNNPDNYRHDRFWSSTVRAKPVQSGRAKFFRLVCFARRRPIRVKRS